MPDLVLHGCLVITDDPYDLSLGNFESPRIIGEVRTTWVPSYSVSPQDWHDAKHKYWGAANDPVIRRSIDRALEWCDGRL